MHLFCFPRNKNTSSFIVSTINSPHPWPRCPPARQEAHGTNRLLCDFRFWHANGCINSRPIVLLNISKHTVHIPRIQASRRPDVRCRYGRHSYRTRTGGGPYCGMKLLVPGCRDWDSGGLGRTASPSSLSSSVSAAGLRGWLLTTPKSLLASSASCVFPDPAMLATAGPSHSTSKASHHSAGTSCAHNLQTCCAVSVDNPTTAAEQKK